MERTHYQSQNFPVNKLQDLRSLQKYMPEQESSHMWKFQKLWLKHQENLEFLQGTVVFGFPDLIFGIGQTN